MLNIQCSRLNAQWYLKFLLLKDCAIYLLVDFRLGKVRQRRTNDNSPGHRPGGGIGDRDNISPVRDDRNIEMTSHDYQRFSKLLNMNGLRE